VKMDGGMAWAPAVAAVRSAAHSTPQMRTVARAALT
jgi:hypothetical protein